MHLSIPYKKIFHDFQANYNRLHCTENRLLYCRQLLPFINIHAKNDNQSGNQIDKPSTAMLFYLCKKLLFMNTHIIRYIQPFSLIIQHNRLLLED